MERIRGGDCDSDEKSGEEELPTTYCAEPPLKLQKRSYESSSGTDPVARSASGEEEDTLIEESVLFGSSSAGTPELSYRVLSYLDAYGLGAISCLSKSGRQLALFENSDQQHTEFSQHWRAHLQVGDRIEVWDYKDKKRLWREAVVVAATEQSVRVHYHAWLPKWDTSLRRASRRLAPIFTHSKDWRFRLRPKQLVEVTRWGGSSGWWVGVVISVNRPRPKARWTSASVAVLGFTRERSNDGNGDNSIHAVCSQRSLSDIPKNRICHIDGFDSEKISWFGDHLGMGLANFRFTTTFLAELHS